MLRIIWLVVDSPHMLFFAVYIVSSTTFLVLDNIERIWWFSGGLFLLLAVVGVVGVVRSCVKSLYFTLIFVLVACTLAGVRISLKLNGEYGMLEEWNSSIGKSAELEGYILREPKERHEDTQYVMRVKTGDLSEVNVLLAAQRFPRQSVGDKCRVKGVLTEPQVFDDFDYKEFLRNRGVSYILQRASLFCDDTDRGGFVVRNLLYDFKSIMVNRVERLLPEPQASLMVGILFGEDRVFDEDFEESLRGSGTTHIIAASGYNVTILILSVNKLMGRLLGLKRRIVVSILVIWMFAVLSGLSPSIVRATVMSSLVLVAFFLGRVSQVHFILLFSAFLFIFIQPRIVFDVSFQLSILATSGLIYLSPILEHYFKLDRGEGSIVNGLKEYFLPTLSCTLVTMPLTLFTFGQVSVVSLLANLLVLPVLEGTMLIGFAGLLVAFLNMGASRWIMMLGWVQLEYFEAVVKALGRLEWAVLEFDIKLSGGVLILVYSVLATVLVVMVPAERLKSSYLFMYTQENAQF